LLIYLDSNIVIYLIEQPPIFGRKASARYAALLAAGDKFIVSDLTRVECRSKPLAAADLLTLRHYDFFFSHAAHQIGWLTTSVCDRATDIRGRYGFKTADALHLAAAIEAGCSTFLTNDVRLNRFPDLTVEVLS
jgi:predicted nucleic acid-binding protein